MELEQLYESIARLKEKGVVVNAYGGSGDPCDPDGGVLGEFMEYIYIAYPRNRPDWLEAFYQVLNWQYQAFYEGVDTFYEDAYGMSPRELQEKAAEYLEAHGYLELANQFRRGMDPAAPGTYREVYQWIGDHQEAVWRFSQNILEEHRVGWPEPEERDADE